MRRRGRRPRGPVALAAALAVAVSAAGSAPEIDAADPQAEETSMKTPTLAKGRAAERGAVPATCLLPGRSSPLVSLRIQFGAGSVDDPQGQEGLAALTAMTIGQGGTAALSFREVTERLFPMAATIQAQPDREVTTFIGEVHRDHLTAFYAILRDLILRPRFDPADFSRNRDLLLSSIETNLRGNDDENLGKAGLQQMMYRGHPYGRQCDSGTVQGLKAITLDDVKRFHAGHYTRARLILGAAGGYPGSFIETMKKDFAALPEGTAERPALNEPQAIERMEVLLIEKPAASTAISIGYPIDVNRGDPDFYPLMVANSYLGEHRTFTGRLMNVMRGARGLNYGDYAYIENFIQDGGSTYPLTNIPRRQQHFEIWIRPVRPENALFALRQAMRELRLLVEKGLGQEDFENTRRYLLNYSRLWAQSQTRRLGMRLDARFHGLDDSLARIQQELPRLTVEQVNAAVRRHLRPDRLAVVMVTDRAADVKRALLSGTPTPITYQTPTTDEALLKEDREIEAYPLPIAPPFVRIVAAQEMFER